MTTDARSNLRAAIRRLMAAVQRPAVEVTVQRRDIEVLLAVNATRLDRAPAPNLHPAQR
jgi:hypothetical protein